MPQKHKKKSGRQPPITNYVKATVAGHHAGQFMMDACIEKDGFGILDPLFEVEHLESGKQGRVTIRVVDIVTVPQKNGEAKAVEENHF